MGISGAFRRLGKATSDGVVGFASGQAQKGKLDSPKSFNLILSMGLVALLASGWLVYHGITSVFHQANTNTTVNTSNTNAASLLSADQVQKLKSQDTDKDGLSDYDELYVYHSSPYLYSSAGDGISDSVKVQQGINPNCRTGQDCPSFSLLTSVTDANGQLTPAFLRQALAQAGVSQTILSKTDDATLLKIYQQIISAQTNSNSNANTNAITNTSNTNATNTSANLNGATNASTSKTDAVQQLQDLTPAQIRTLLIDNGVDQTSLNSVDDATLRSIFQQSVSSATNSASSQ